MRRKEYAPLLVVLALIALTLFTVSTLTPDSHEAPPASLDPIHEVYGAGPPPVFEVESRPPPRETRHRRHDGR